MLTETKSKFTDYDFTSTLGDQYIIRGATLNDVEAAVELFNACSLHTKGEIETNIEEIRTDWQTPGFELEKSTRVFLTSDGRMVGYVEVWDVNDLPVKIFVWGRVHPDYENQGIGTWLMNWGEQRARQAIPRVPADVKVVMNSGTISSYDPPKQLFQELGMKLVRNFWDMGIELDKPIPQAKFVNGIEIRTFADLPDLTKIYRAIAEAFKDHWGFVEQPEDEALERWRHWIENDEDFDPSLWFLAMDGDEIAAVSLCRPKLPRDPEMGYVNTLGVRRSWRRQGIALGLLHHTFAEFARRGQKRVGLGVDAGSLTGATRLYNKAGMRVKRQFDTYEKVLRPGIDLSTTSVDD